MNPSDDALRKLAAQMHCGPAPYPDRETLEASLVPIIRRVLRCGRGIPGLVQWVQRHLPGRAADPDKHSDPAWAAPSMARLLCDKLLEQVGAQPALAGVTGSPARETIVDR